MLYLFYGPDSFSKAEAVAALKQRLDTDGMLTINTVTLDGARISLAEVEAVCNTVPFLAAQRLVIIMGLIERPAPRQRPGRASSRQATAETTNVELSAFVEYVQRLPATTTLLLLENTLRSDNPAVKTLRSLGEVRAFPALDEQQTEAWIEGRAKEIGAVFQPSAVRLLASFTRGDLWSTANEVEKLSLYADGRAVTEDDVVLMVPAAQEGNVFAMVDAIVEGRLRDAVRGLELLLQTGAAGPYLLAMIARQFRQLLIVQDLLARGAPQQEMARAAEIRSDPALRRVMRQARGWSAARLMAAHERILGADLTIKRGEAAEAVALELLVTDLVARP